MSDTGRSCSIRSLLVVCVCAMCTSNEANVHVKKKHTRRHVEADDIDLFDKVCCGWFILILLNLDHYPSTRFSLGLNPQLRLISFAFPFWTSIYSHQLTPTHTNLHQPTPIRTTYMQESPHPTPTHARLAWATPLALSKCKLFPLPRPLNTQPGLNYHYSGLY